MNNYQKHMFDLIKFYLSKRCSTNDFCESFTDIYNHWLPSNEKFEYSGLLQKICYLCERYSPYEEDTLKHGNFFIDEKTFQHELAMVLEDSKIGDD